MGQPLEREDEQDGRDQIGDGLMVGEYSVKSIWCALFLLLEHRQHPVRHQKAAEDVDAGQQHGEEAHGRGVKPASSSPVTSSAPTSTMPEMALVSATSGVCSEGVTPQMT
jgi:CO dehydrogenase/acetyl-CoA synthase beta subunit